MAEEMALRMAGCDTEQVGHASRREVSGPDGASGMGAGASVAYPEVEKKETYAKIGNIYDVN